MGVSYRAVKVPCFQRTVEGAFPTCVAAAGVYIAMNSTAILSQRESHCKTEKGKERTE